MQSKAIRNNVEYHDHLNSLYSGEPGQSARVSTYTSTVPAILTDEEAHGFQDRFKLIRQFLEITNNLFRKSFTDSSLKRVRELTLNEFNVDFAQSYHESLYQRPTDIPQFFRTDEPIPGKIGEIQCPASGWGYIDVLQRSIPKLSQYADFPIREFNKVPMAERVAESIKQITDGNPNVFHQIDCSSHMVDMHYFIGKTRRYGIRYLGRDSEVTFKNLTLVRSHDVTETVTNIEFLAQLENFYKGKLRFDLFPSIVFDEKIPLTFPFWSKTRDRYSDEIRDIFPFASLLEPNKITLEDGSNVSIEEFAHSAPSGRGYYLKYAGANNQLCWGSKGVYNLASGSHQQCLALLREAASGYEHKRYWILQKAYHRSESFDVYQNGSMTSRPLYSKYSGFYGPQGFMGGFVMSRASKKVHGQDDTITRVLL